MYENNKSEMVEFPGKNVEVVEERETSTSKFVYGLLFST